MTKSELEALVINQRKELAKLNQFTRTWWYTFWRLKQRMFDYILFIIFKLYGQVRSRED